MNIYFKSKYVSRYVLTYKSIRTIGNKSLMLYGLFVKELLMNFFLNFHHLWLFPYLIVHIYNSLYEKEEVVPDLVPNDHDLVILVTGERCYGSRCSHPQPQPQDDVEVDQVLPVVPAGVVLLIGGCC